MAQTILITGATDGIGLLAAQKLVGAGHKVLLHGRSAAKLSKAAAKVGGSPQTYCADLSRLSEVHLLAQTVRAEHKTLDVLINNAGVLKAPQTRTEAGRDIRFDVNTIAPYLLTRALLPLMPKEGRVVNVSSAAQAPVDTGAMMAFRPMGDMEAYAQSKLALMIWSAELAKDLPQGPCVVSVNPGSLLATKMVKEGFGLSGNDLTIGADILVAAATGDDFADASGAYYDNDSSRFAAPHPAADDPDQVAAVMAALQTLPQA